VAKPIIKYYTVNAPEGQEWREVSYWPSYPKAKLFLDDGNGLTAKPPGAGSSRVDYAPQPVRWLKGQYNSLMRTSPNDMTEADAASLLHTMAPFTTDREVTGTITANLWISADQPDVDLFAVIEDVAPDGRSAYVTDGRLRASWRKINPLPWGGNTRTWHRGYAKDIAPLKAGQPNLMRFDFYPISYVFKTGHRMRIALATSIGEAYQSPPLANGKRATISLYRDSKNPSAIEVPFVTK
jgi:putative CocE/NonD family hydrolase